MSPFQFGRLDLLASVVQQGYIASQGGQGEEFIAIVKDTAFASKALVGPGVTEMAEILRTEDMGVTIRGFSSVVFPVDFSWWEWGRNVKGFIPAQNREEVIDRSGILVSSSDGQQGFMHCIDRYPNVLVDGVPLIILAPMAVAFDFRDQSSPVDTLFPRISVGETRDLLSLVKNPTTAQVEASPVTLTAISSRFGLVHSKYYAGSEFIAQKIREVRHSEDHSLFQNEITQDATFLACIMLAKQASDVTTTQHSATSMWKGRTPRATDNAFAYSSIDRS